MYLHVIYSFLALYLMHYPIYHQPFNHDSGGSCDSHRIIYDHSDHEVLDKENYIKLSPIIIQIVHIELIQLRRINLKDLRQQLLRPLLVEN